MGVPGADKPNNAYPGAFRSDLAYPREIVSGGATNMHLKGLNGNKDLGPAKTLMDPFWPENPSGLPRKARFHVEKGLSSDITPPWNGYKWWHAPHAYYNPSPLKHLSFRADGGDEPFKRTLGQFDHGRCSKQASRCSSDGSYRKTMDAQWKSVIRGKGDVWKDHDETLRSLPAHARTAGRAVMRATREWINSTDSKDQGLSKSASAPGCCTPGPNSKGLKRSTTESPGDVSLNSTVKESVHGRTQRERLVKVLAKYAAEKAAASLERQLKREAHRRLVAEETLRRTQ